MHVHLYSCFQAVVQNQLLLQFRLNRTAYLHGFQAGDVVLNFGSVKLDGELIRYPYDLDQQGFTILCTSPSCQSFFGFKFDAGMEEGTGELGGTDETPFYTIGIKGARSAAEVAEAFFNGIASAIGLDPEELGDTITLESVHTLTIKRMGDQYSFNQNYASYWIYEGYDASYAPDDDYELVVDPGHAKDWNAITVHHGPHANQGTNFYINDMRSAALGIDVASVINKDSAKAAIDVIESALEYAINEATNVGASLARLEHTENNVSTEVENVQAAESTIRDADMAKSITEYTRWNVLMQSSQSMLAQANQNASSVIGLLQ